MSYERIDTEPFVNPYNFVSLPEGEVKRGAVSNNAGKTGKLHCRIATKTPLAVPDTDYREDHKHKIYAFNTIDGKKAISGSSIRGCIRSVYETLTDSCFVTMSDNEYISNRVGAKNAYKPGLLVKEDEGWKLYRAERMLVKVAKTPISEATLFTEDEKVNDEGIPERYIKYKGEDYHFGDFVSVTKRDIGQQPRVRSFVTHMKKVDAEDYCLYIGEPMEGRKKYQSVFKRKSALEIENRIISGAINSLDFVADMYKDRAINRNYAENKHHGYGGYERAKRNGTIPVWYSWDERSKNLSLSLAAIGRKVYDKTVNELSNGRIPCKERSNVCPACSLFGMAKGDGIGSKVRFSDAFITKEGSSSYVTLKELGSPRTGYYLFYSANGMEFDNPGAEISGRKFYWHIPEASTNEDIYKASGTDAKTERNSTVEILKDSEFEFDVYYDNISERQLSELKFALTFGDKEDGSLCHKLGHGKPLGLGSVKISIASESIRRFDESGYSVETLTDVDTFCDSDRFSKCSKEELLRMSDFNAVKGEKVCYPYVLGESTNANDTASHQWFAKNRVANKVQTLSSPTGSIQSLYPYEFDNNDDEKQRNATAGKQKYGNDNKQREIKHYQQTGYEIGKEYSGIVTGRNPSGKYAWLKVLPNGKASVLDPKCKLKMDENVTIIYNGKDAKGYDNWTVK